MYTKNDILLESAFFGDIVKIDVATDMLCESYIDQMLGAEDEETYLEAGKGVIGSILKMIQSAVDRISKFLRDKVSGMRKSKEMKNILKTLEPETRKAIMNMRKGEKVKLPDVAKASKLLDQAEKGMDIMVQKVSSTIAAMENMKPSKKAKELDKLNKYIDVSTEKIANIYENVNQILSNPINVSLETAFKYMEQGVDLTKRCENLEKNLANYGKEISAAVKKIDLTIVEEKSNAIDDTVASVKDTITTSETLSGVRGSISKTLGKISDFTHRHATATYRIMGLFRIYMGLSAVGNVMGTVGGKNIYDKATSAVGAGINVALISATDKAYGKYKSEHLANKEARKRTKTDSSNKNK